VPSRSICSRSVPDPGGSGGDPRGPDTFASATKAARRCWAPAASDQPLAAGNRRTAAGPDQRCERHTGQRQAAGSVRLRLGTSGHSAELIDCPITTGLSATPAHPACPSRASGRSSQPTMGWGFPELRRSPSDTHAVASTPAESLDYMLLSNHFHDPLHRRLQPLRYLHDCSVYYRLKQQFPGC